MALKVCAPEIEMGGGQVIRVANEDRPTSWITFHFSQRWTRLPLISSYLKLSAKR